ncbi:putative spore germination protein GerPC [Halobacillus andaensis]|uniref:Spore germination protein GerPC n=1 Tax=Halobacillus andaensis TaxID=1176239 RepID=A0A917B1A5_HALAA|nr:spore germination protein GerPC [Halobacillus andaensis]MBP2004094.1 spore germination protein PC [Halobacillus andaensis]GGF15751.1 putative spore germination protein GerPC [Halobacillus andaensis]
MNNYYSWDQWMQQVMEQMQEQQRLIEELTQKLEHLQSKEQTKTVIEKIEYHFDQLKIETLEGTLQIGLTPNGSPETNIEDLYTGQTAEPYLDELMGHSVPQAIDDYVRSHHLSLPGDHRDHMIKDINQQLPERFEAHKKHEPNLSNEQIAQRLAEEIRRSVGQYLDQYENGGSE